MPPKATFDRLWHMHDDFKFPELEPEDDSCVFAKRYRAWAESACRQVQANPQVDEIHEVMLLNTLKYFEFRNAVPLAHRNLMSDRGHTCIWHVFEATFQLLKVKLLSLPQHTTLLLPKPLPPPPPPPPQIAGVPFGIIRRSE